MSKALNASCVSGVVKVGDDIVAGATILSEGVKASEGLLVMQGNQKTYVTSNASDLKTAIQDVAALLNQVGAILSALDAVTLAPGTTTAATAAFQAARAQFALTAEALK